MGQNLTVVEKAHDRTGPGPPLPSLLVQFDLVPELQIKLQLQVRHVHEESATSMLELVVEP